MGNVLNVVEHWNVHKNINEFMYLPTMREHRYSPCCTVYDVEERQNEYIFVGGGWRRNSKKRGGEILTSCEVFNFERGIWTEIQSMNVARYAGGCCVWQNASSQKTIVIGGGRADGASQSVEQYDFHKNRWYNLPNTRCSHRNAPSLWIAKEYGKISSPFNGLLFIGGDVWTKDDQQTEGCINGYIECYDHREWRRQWFIVEDLKNILVQDRNAVIRAMLPFS